MTDAEVIAIVEEITGETASVKRAEMWGYTSVTIALQPSDVIFMVTQSSLDEAPDHTIFRDALQRRWDQILPTL